MLSKFRAHFILEEFIVNPMKYEVVVLLHIEFKIRMNGAANHFIGLPQFYKS